MESTVEEMEKVLTAEIDLARAMLDIVRDKQRSIVTMDGAGLLRILERERTILRPLEAVEKERVRLSVTAEWSEDNPRIRPLTDTLKSVVRLILTTDALNKDMLDRSLAFMRETLRLITENYSLQLLDRKG